VPIIYVFVDLNATSMPALEGKCTRLRASMSTNYGEMGLFRDPRKLAEIHQIGIPELRRLDDQAKVLPNFDSPPAGQPLSLVLDKIFYKPNAPNA
jgi:hypothetical protein